MIVTKRKEKPWRKNLIDLTKTKKGLLSCKITSRKQEKFPGFH